MKHTLLVIVGPTGIGKTAVSIDIAQRLDTEIISCDSRQIYKEMSIGTARPDDEQLAKVKHHFIATQSVMDYYNASMFEFAVLDLLNKLFTTHPVVIMTGGSGLYVDAVCKGIDDLPTIDPHVRKAVLDTYLSQGIEVLLAELQAVDPVYYATADIQNPKRVFKAIEIYRMTGRPYSSFLTKSIKNRDFNIVTIGLNRDRQELYTNIDNRVDAMMQAGLLEEARSLKHLKHSNALNTVGYKELYDYFDNKCTLEEAVELIKRNTRRYAKRQLTWFTRDKKTVWFHPEEKDKILQFVNEVI